MPATARSRRTNARRGCTAIGYHRSRRNEARPHSIPVMGSGFILPMRCWWCGTDPLYVRYHDEEWGRPVTDDNRLFEKICLEGVRAGLSRLTILRKREASRDVFPGVEIDRGARFRDRDLPRRRLVAGRI